MKSLIKIIIMCTQLTMIPTAIGADLRLDVGGSMANVMPVPNQGNLGTCYAHAASQATDAYIHTFTQENEVWHTSTTMLGTEYSDTFLTRFSSKPGDIEGGLVCTSFRRSIKKYGACAASSIEGLLDKMYLAYQMPYRLSRFFNDLTYRFQETQWDKKRFGNNAFQRGAQKLLVTLGQAGALPSDLPSLEEIAVALNSRSNLQFARKFFAVLCSSTPRVQLSDVKCRNNHLWLRSKRGTKKLIETFRLSLKQRNAQPIMISYCGSVLQKGRKYRGLGNALLDPFKLGACGYHASAIIGVRELNTVSQFLIRNSWGESCSGYSPDWECDKGNLWVDAEVLAKNMTDYHLLVRKRR